MDKSQARGLLQAAVGREDVDFREGQWEAINAVVNARRKLLVVQRTGWGKSSVYFIATRILRDAGSGPTIIISPLLALMRNQVEAASRLGIRAATINSANTDEWQVITDQILANEVDAVLISPERLSNEGFLEDVLMPIADRIGLLVVDEAHCISDWGHDFRPDYRRLTNILRQMPPNMPVLGTTATANNRVIQDVQEQLGDIDVIRGTLVRSSLALQATQLATQAERLGWLAQHIPAMPGTGIVYVLTKRDADVVSAWLNSNGIVASAYYSGAEHAGFESSDAYRQHLENSLLNNEIKVLVATTALGMGYDKPDLGFVIHYQSAGSVVAYYQQVGRAGRAIDQAFGVLLTGTEDSDIHDFFRRTAFPDERDVECILDALDNSDGLSVRELEVQANLRQGQIEKVLKYLNVETPAPLIKDGSKWMRTPVAYVMDHDKIQRLTAQREVEWQEMRDYLRSQTCLMEYLRNALDDPESEPCGKCAVCLDRDLFSTDVEPGLIIAANLFLRNSERPLLTKKQVAKDGFPVYGFRGNLSAELQAREGRVLARWGDAGWGQMVLEDKYAGHFRDELIEAVVEMYQQRWTPAPAPTWVTCVPSKAQPDLVSGFASRLAAALGLPFVACVTKVRDNEQQKMQHNRFHQCRNLDGAFEVEGVIPEGPVLVVDDVVDSAWTLTVIAALLRQAGSGEVYPLALASNSPGQ